MRLFEIIFEQPQNNIDFYCILVKISYECQRSSAGRATDL